MEGLDLNYSDLKWIFDCFDIYIILIAYCMKFELQNWLKVAETRKVILKRDILEKKNVRNLQDEKLKDAVIFGI